MQRLLEVWRLLEGNAYLRRGAYYSKYGMRWIYLSQVLWKER